MTINLFCETCEKTVKITNQNEGNKARNWIFLHKLEFSFFDFGLFNGCGSDSWKYEFKEVPRNSPEFCSQKCFGIWIKKQAKQHEQMMIESTLFDVEKVEEEKKEGKKDANER